MVMCGVLFEVRTEFLNIIKVSVSFKGLKIKFKLVICSAVYGLPAVYGLLKCTCTLVIWRTPGQETTCRSVVVDGRIIEWSVVSFCEHDDEHVCGIVKAFLYHLSIFCSRKTYTTEIQLLVDNSDLSFSTLYILYFLDNWGYLYTGLVKFCFCAVN
jgi:hypothetical protein